MTGEALYKIYAKENEKLGVGVDEWDDLGDDQEVWEAMAEKLSPAEECT